MLLGWRMFSTARTTTSRILVSFGVGAVYLATQIRPLTPGSLLRSFWVEDMVVGFEGVRNDRITATVNSVLKSRYLLGGDICSKCNKTTRATRGSLGKICMYILSWSASMSKRLDFSYEDMADNGTYGRR